MSTSINPGNEHDRFNGANGSGTDKTSGARNRSAQQAIADATAPKVQGIEIEADIQQIENLMARLGELLRREVSRGASKPAIGGRVQNRPVL